MVATDKIGRQKIIRDFYFKLILESVTDQSKPKNAGPRYLTEHLTLKSVQRKVIHPNILIFYNGNTRYFTN